MVQKVVSFGEHNAAVDYHEFSKCSRLVYFDGLIRCFDFAEFGFNLQPKARAGAGKNFFEPGCLFYHSADAILSDLTVYQIF